MLRFTLTLTVSIMFSVLLLTHFYGYCNWNNKEVIGETKT
jgi:hypothetical protein